MFSFKISHKGCIYIIDRDNKMEEEETRHEATEETRGKDHSMHEKRQDKI